MSASLLLDKPTPGCPPCLPPLPAPLPVPLCCPWQRAAAEDFDEEEQEALEAENEAEEELYDQVGGAGRAAQPAQPAFWTLFSLALCSVSRFSLLDAPRVCATQVGSCLGSFLKSFGDAALPYVEGLMPSIAPLLDKARPDEERRIAMCIIDDMLEHSAQGRAKYLAQVRVGRERGTHDSPRQSGM